VPRAPDYVLGILSLRGAVIPVFDLRRRLRLGLTEPTRKSRIVVVAVGKFMVGLIVDEVMQVVRLPETKLEPPPSMLNAVEAEYIEAIGRTGAKMIILLALEKILTPVSGNKG
jgi:purine-binding chemotaxis protein CheW